MVARAYDAAALCECTHTYGRHSPDGYCTTYLCACERFRYKAPLDAPERVKHSHGGLEHRHFVRPSHLEIHDHTPGQALCGHVLCSRDGADGHGHRCIIEYRTFTGPRNDGTEEAARAHLAACVVDRATAGALRASLEPPPTEPSKIMRG